MKTQIFKYAHKIAKEWNSYKMRVKFQNFNLKYSDLFAEALKLAYKKLTEKAVKNTVKLFASFVSETEKAYLLTVTLANGALKNVWIPKSLININTFEIESWFLTKNNLHVQRV